MTLAEALTAPELDIPRRDALTVVDGLRAESAQHLGALAATVRRYLMGKASLKELTAAHAEVEAYHANLTAAADAAVRWPAPSEETD